MIPWYFAVAFAIGTLAIGAGLGYLRGYRVATLRALGQVLDQISQTAGRIKP